MNKGINLLDANQQTKSGIELRKIRFMRLIAVVSLFLVSVASIILFMLVALSPLPQLQQQEQGLRDTLANSKQALAQHALVNERTDEITKILGSRISFDVPLTTIREKLPSNAKVSAIKADSSSIILTVSTPTLESLDSFLNEMIGLVKEKQVFSQIQLSDLATDDGRDNFTMTVTLYMAKEIAKE